MAYRGSTQRLLRVAHAASSALAAFCLAVFCLAGCEGAFDRTEMEGFVDNGLSVVMIRSADFSLTGPGGDGVSIVPSGAAITADVELVNPKSFAVVYATAFDSALFAEAPPAEPAPSAPKLLSFPFTLASSAEHTTVEISISKYVPSINKRYPAETIRVKCDSPPNPARKPDTAEDGNRLVLAFTLPDEASDDDLERVTVDWRKESPSSPESGTIDSALADLAAVPSVNPYRGEKPAYRYCVLGNIETGRAYTFDITLVDAIGQKSAPVSVSSDRHLFALAYDGNGADSGAPPESDRHALDTPLTIAGHGTLQKTDSAFVSWNTDPLGAGTRYYPGDAFTMPNRDVTLYAQWSDNATTVSFDIGVRGLEFDPSAILVKASVPVTLACGNPDLATGGTGWVWFVDGIAVPDASGKELVWSTEEVGDHVISCAVNYRGETLSGYLKATVTP